MSIMLLFYIDESGNDSLTAKSVVRYPWFILGSVAFQDTQRIDIASDLIDLKRDIWGRPYSSNLSRSRLGMPPTWNGTLAEWNRYEIKGSRLADAIRRRDVGKTPRHATWSGLSLSQLRVVEDRMVGLLHKHRPYLYFVAIHKTSLLNFHDRLEANGTFPKGKARATLDVVPLAYALLQQRASLLVRSVFRGSPAALMLADEQQSHEKRYPEIKATQEWISTTLRDKPDYRLMFEKPLWVKTSELELDRELIQLADFCTYAVGRSLGGTKPTREAWFDRIEPFIARRWGRESWRNAGLTCYPQYAPQLN